MIEVLYTTVTSTVTAKEEPPMGGFNDDGRRAWRIKVWCMDGLAGIVPVKFARKSDAERGIEVLKRLVRLDGTYDEVRGSLLEVGAMEIRKALAEAMAW